MEMFILHTLGNIPFTVATFIRFQQLKKNQLKFLGNRSNNLQNYSKKQIYLYLIVQYKEKYFPMYGQSNEKFYLYVLISMNDESFELDE